MLVEVAAFDTADGLYDCCWSEENENILVSASGDGSVKVHASSYSCICPSPISRHLSVASYTALLLMFCVLSYWNSRTINTKYQTKRTNQTR